MIKTRDDIHPRGTVEIECPACHWAFWVGALDPRLPGPFECPSCDGTDNGEKAPGGKAK